jgi:uncharacterized membrane protein
MTPLVVVAASLMAVVGCADRRETTFAFTELAFPGAELTVAAGINEAGHIVGWYREEDRTSGFIYKDGTYTSVEYPAAILTQLYGINAQGDVVGAYRREGEPTIAYHGFLRRASGEFVEVGHPDHKYSIAQRLLADGTIVGCYHDDDFTTTMRGIVVPPDAIGATGVTASAVDVIERSASMTNGATPDRGKVIGLLMDSRQAFIQDRGVLTAFGAPGAERTEAWDINPSGTIVGMFVDAAAVSHGYVLEGERYTTIDVPGAAGTVTFGINAGGDIVGGFTGADGQRRGYLASRR